MEHTSPIRVLHVFGVLDKGGAESRTMDIYRAINHSAVQFDFAVHTDKIGAYEDEIVKLGGKVYHDIPRFSLLNAFAYYRAWQKLLSAHPYNIVHIHTTNSAIPIALAARRSKATKIIAHARNAGESSFPRWLFARLQRKWLCNVTTDKLAVSNAAGEFIFGDKKCFLCIPNAVPLDDYRFSEDVRWQMRKALGLGDSLIIVMIGRFVPMKNHLFALDAFAKLLTQKPNCHLLLVGDGEIKSDIEAKIHALHIDEQVTLTGVRNDIRCILQAADLFIMPSLFEGLPGAAIEAQAAGLPCLMSDQITQECNILPDRVAYLPITNIDLWVTEMAKLLELKTINRDTVTILQAAGFDVVQGAKWYSDFYLSSK